MLNQPADLADAQVVLPARPLAETVAFFVEQLGFQVASVLPADSPRIVVVTRSRLTIALDQDASGPPGKLRIGATDRNRTGASLEAPNGTQIEVFDPQSPMTVPDVAPSWVVTRGEGEGGWHVGRAGMQYRDLLPGRQGGRFIASHIRIHTGGPVGDFVHHHRIRFQMIYCYRGWVKVVYEDQGPPLVMHPGDCFLQPPGIRHQVLESSPGLEVIEIGCPAEHDTYADLEMALPTSVVDPNREFGGQRFVHHQAAKTSWEAWHIPGFECRPFGFDSATSGAAEARTVRTTGTGHTPAGSHSAELMFNFVLQGAMTVSADGRPAVPLKRGDCVTVPRDHVYSLVDCTDDLQFLEVVLPAPALSP